MSIWTDITNALSNNPVAVGIKNGFDTLQGLVSGQNVGQTLTHGLENLQPVAPIPQPTAVTQATHDVTQTVGDIPKDVSSISSAISSVSDFVSFIAWIFYPANILRAVEFVVGITMILFGLTKFRGIGGVARGAISATPVGRVVRVRQGARMGRREGQREAARMRARQIETRPVRQESAYERERISRDARQRARS